jgi:hypothetical protein
VIADEPTAHRDYIQVEGVLPGVRQHSALSRADGSTEDIIRVEPGGYFGELGPMLKLPRS